MEISKIAVNGSTYDIKDTSTSINGKTGAIGASDIASVLTTAGYELTDHNTTYQFAQSGNSLQMGTDNGTKSTIYTPTLTKGNKGDKGDKGDGVTSATQTTSSTASSGKNTVTFKVGSTVVGSIDVYNGAKGDKGDKGDTGASGSNGSNGVSCTHSWDGTTLTITSASGSSSANLKGDTGATGPQGPQGIQGILGPKGDDGLTTQITVNGTTYTLSSGNITLPNYPTSTSQLTNNSGYITGITKSMVTTALGYTPPMSDTNTVTSINGKTGDIAASDIATVLTSAGYKLTDADTNTWRPVQCNSTDIGSNTLNIVAGSNVNLSRSGGTITINSSYTDTNTWRPISDSVSSTSSDTSASSNAVKTAYDLAASKTSNTGTVTSVAAGTGLSGGTITTSGTLSVAYGNTKGTACQGNDSRLSNSRPASDVYAWAKKSTKPTYIANEVMYIHTMESTGNGTSWCTITGSSDVGKAETVIYINTTDTDYTVIVPTVYKTPDGEPIELTCPAGGYCEVSYLNIGGTIYARGL